MAIECLSYSITISMDAKQQSIFGPFIQDKPAFLITSSFFCSNFDGIQITMSFRKYALVKMTNKEKVE